MKAGDINVSVHVATRAVGGRLDAEGKKLIAKGWARNRVKVNSNSRDTLVPRPASRKPLGTLYLGRQIFQASKEQTRIQKSGLEIEVATLAGRRKARAPADCKGGSHPQAGEDPVPQKKQDGQGDQGSTPPPLQPGSPPPLLFTLLSFAMKAMMCVPLY